MGAQTLMPWFCISTIAILSISAPFPCTGKLPTLAGLESPNTARDHPPDRPEGHYGKLPNGVLAARFGKQGHLATAGRNQTITLWSPVGDPLQSFALESALPISTAIAHDSSKLMVGGSDGSLTFWPLDEQPNAGRSE